MSSLILGARLETSKVSKNQVHKQHLLVTLEGKKVEAERKALALSAAIDVSGSMAGQKIEDAKSGLEKLVDHLSEKDTLAIIAFSNQAWTVSEPRSMDASGKEAARKAIRELGAGGSTNLSGGTLQAYEHARSEAGRKSKDMVSRVLIFTDGCPTTGEMDPERLRAIAKGRPEGTNLICFGYGSDYDAELMTSMAKAAGGEAYHITNPDEFGPTLGRVLGGLLTCIAQNVKLTLKMKPDVKILEILNDFDVKGNDEKTEATVTVDDVYSEEKRGVVAQIELPAMDLSSRPFKFGTALVTYQDLVSREERKEEISLEVEYVKESEADKDADKEVAEKVALLKAAQAQEEALKLAKAGNFAGAQSIVRGAMSRLSGVGTIMAMGAVQDLENNVNACLSPLAFAQGGEHYLRASSSSYSTGRGHTAGAAKLYSTKAMRSMEAAFTQPKAQDAGLPKGTIVPGMPGFVFDPSKAPFFGGPVSPGQGQQGVGLTQDPAIQVPTTKAKQNLTKKRTRR